MKQYEKYKSSGIEWIGNIPNHWSIYKLKYLIRNKISDGPHESPEFLNAGIPFLSVDGIQDGELVFEGCRFISESEHKRFQQKTVVEKGDILMGKAASIGKIARVKVDFDFSVWSPLAIIKPNDKIYNPFLEYYLKSPLSQNQIETLCTLNTQKNISMEDIPKILVILPSKTEQTEIANFLDIKTNEITQLISQKQKLIEILKEERIAITNTAVTRGLNPKAKMKPSGVDWIGDIPEQWKVTRVKYVCTVQGRIGFKGYKSSDLVSEGEGALVLGATHITRDHKIDITEPVFLRWEKYYESPEIMVKQGDVVFTQRGVYLGKVALIDRDYKYVTINPSLILLKENLINSGYLTFYLTSHYIRKTIELISSNTAIPMISQENLSNFYCLVPPDKVQNEIFDFVNKSNIKIDLTISQIEKEIELMQEYRTALISEVVTGKIKVTA